MTSASPETQRQRVALIVAAGAGTRMAQALPKQYLTLNEQPMLAFCIETFCAHADIARVCVVLHPEDKWFAQYDWRAYEGRLTPHFCGGGSRAESVRNGLQALREQLTDDDWVLVHDAARPCLTPELLSRLIGELDEDEAGGLLAVPLADTLKREDGTRHVMRTEPRDQLWQAQTPQMFRYGLLLRAMSGELTAVTDEASAVERLGVRPRLVLGSIANLKVTYAEDAELAALILRGRA